MNASLARRRLPLTRAILPEVHWLDRAASTNQALRELALVRGDLPHGTLLVTAHQTDGRGRRGRSWVAPPETALAASLLLRPEAVVGAPSALSPSWLPLLAGSAVAAALQPLFDRAAAASGREPTGAASQADRVKRAHGGSVWQTARRVGVKWPNDVHVRAVADAKRGLPGAKLCGILCEALSTGEIIVGCGINLLQSAAQLPTERAGSALSCGADVNDALTLADERGAALADQVLATASGELLRLAALARTQPEAARARVLRDSLTIGTQVRVHLPSGETVRGSATGLASDGALLIECDGGDSFAVNAADIEHLRASPRGC